MADRKTHGEHNNVAIIVAAGRGTRARGAKERNSLTPKQYADLAGTPVLARTLGPYLTHPEITRIVVIIHQDDQALYETCIANISDRSRLMPPVIGGASRQDSVYNGLVSLAGDPPRHVLVHDAARPFVDAALITRVCTGLKDHDAVTPVLALSDTLALIDEKAYVQETPARAHYRRAQTPQGFLYQAILNAHQRARETTDRTFTDDAQIAHEAGIPVICVAGSDNNTKLTNPEDLVQARQKLSAMDASYLSLSQIRTGIGYDVHRFTRGGGVILGGVSIAHTQALAGHSDADVVLHALTDAVLGALAEGDIGQHFPPSDCRWKGASSDIFLRFACERVRKRNGTINHLDVTLICEAPRIAPHARAMARNIARITGIDSTRVSVKSTTSEGLGFTGRNEGIAAQALATLALPDPPPPHNNDAHDYDYHHDHDETAHLE